MSDAALSRIANLISVEDDLVKVSSLREQFIKEKASIDVKLNNATKLQIDSILSNLTKLTKSSGKLNNIKAEINKINAIFDDSITNLTEYETMKIMTSVNKTLTQVLNLQFDISNFKRSLDTINELIDYEYLIILEDITYPLQTIFKIHYNITQARNLLDYLEVHSKTLSDDLKSILRRLILPLRTTVKKFDDLLKEVIISLTEAVKEQNNELVFKLIEIIEFETKEDLKLALETKLEVNSNLSNMNYGTTRLIKRNYKKFFYDKLEESLQETFDKCVEHFSEDKMMVYDNLNWLEDELVFVNDNLSLVFPKHWDVNGFIQNVYYNRLHNFTMDLIKTDPPAEDLLRILAYDTHYNKFLLALQSLDDDPKAPGDKSKRKSMKPQSRSIIGEDLKNVVLEDYLKVIVSKMEEWNENLMQQETKTFSERAYPPDLYNYHQVIEDDDAQDQPVMLDIETAVYVLPDFKTPLTMLKEQADVAADSGYGKILVGVIEHWSNCYIKRVINYQQIIDEEYDNYMSIYNNERFLIKESKTKKLFRRKRPAYVNLDEMTQEELSNISREGLIEYLAALGNTFEINTDRLQDKFLPSYKEKVHTNYQGQIETSFEDTVTPSTELNAQIIRTIVDIIVNDLYPALSQVFTKAWYDDANQKHLTDNKNMAQRVVETIAEYMEELRGYTTYDIYLVTFNVLLDSFIASYIRIGYENILHGEGKKIDPTAVKKFKSFSEAVGRDITIIYGGLEYLFTRKDAAYLLNSLRAIEFLGDLGTCENPLEFIPQMWENEILGSFYYCSIEYIRGVCLCRKDMDRNQVNLLVNQLVKIQKTYHEQVDPPAMITGTLNDFYYN